jgi:uncharacterized protein YggE
MSFFTRNTALSAATTVGLCAAIALMASGSTPIAAENAGAIVRTISVSGHGEVKGTPDEAHLTAGVMTEGKTAAEALAANSRAMNNVFATLKRLGIPERHIQTSNFNISPRYADADEGRPYVPRIVAYQVTNTVNVTIAGVDRAGPALDALVSSGANQSHGIFFTIADPKPLAEKARREAVADAIAKARTLADAHGIRLGRVLSINEGIGYAPPIPMEERVVVTSSRLPAAPPPPVAAGEATVAVNVSVVYEIQ